MFPIERVPTHLGRELVPESPFSPFLSPPSSLSSLSLSLSSLSPLRRSWLRASGRTGEREARRLAGLVGALPPAEPAVAITSAVSCESSIVSGSKLVAFGAGGRDKDSRVVEAGAVRRGANILEMSPLEAGPNVSLATGGAAALGEGLVFVMGFGSSRLDATVDVACELYHESILPNVSEDEELEDDPTEDPLEEVEPEQVVDCDASAAAVGVIVRRKIAVTAA